MNRGPGNAENGDSSNRLQIIRTFPGDRKIKRVRVLKHGVIPVMLVLEETSRGRWRDQNNHFWSFEGKELVAAR